MLCALHEDKHIGRGRLVVNGSRVPRDTALGLVRLRDLTIHTDKPICSAGLCKYSEELSRSITHVVFTLGLGRQMPFRRDGAALTTNERWCPFP